MILSAIEWCEHDRYSAAEWRQPPYLLLDHKTFGAMHLPLRDVMESRGCGACKLWEWKRGPGNTST